MNPLNRSKQTPPKTVYDLRHQRAVLLKWLLRAVVLIGAFILIAGSLWGMSRLRELIQPGPGVTEIVEVATEMPTVSTPMPTMPAPTATTPVSTPGSLTAIPTETWTPTPVPLTATPTETPSATPSPTTTVTPTETPTPVQVLGEIIVPGAQVNTLPVGNNPVGPFEFGGRQVIALPEGAVVVLCAKNGARYHVAEAICTDETLLGWVTEGFIEVLSDTFPPELITPAPEL